MSPSTRKPRTQRSTSTTLPNLLDNGADRRFRQLIQALFGLSARLLTLREKLGAIAGMSGPQYSMLVSIAHLAGDGPGVSVNELAAHLHVSGTYVTAESKKLEAKGLLDRTPNPHDRRSVLLRLSGEGRGCMAEVLPSVRAINDALFEVLGRRDFEVLHASLTRLVEAADDALLVAERERRRRGSLNGA